MSAFNLLAVRELGDPEDALYPSPSEDKPDSVTFTDQDGTITAPITTTELVVGELLPGSTPQRLVRVSDVKAQMQLTDRRIVIACSKYESGGGWRPFGLGAVPVALAANAVSKAKASKRRAGKMLVGQLPYTQLLSVGARPSAAFGHDHLRLSMRDPSTESLRVLLLDLRLARGQAADNLAQRITGYVATKRLEAHGAQLDPAHTSHLERLRQPALLTTQAKAYISYFLAPTLDEQLQAQLQKG